MQTDSAYNATAQILRCLPETLKTCVTEKDLMYAEELRLRAGSRMVLLRNGQSIPVRQKAVSAQEIAETVMRMCNHSVYAAMEQIKNGFLVLPGGVRVGLAGQVVHRDAEVQNMKEFTGLNFRIPHEIVGCADKLLSHVIENGRVKNTVVISPPGCGKTTLLRDLTRSISAKGYKVCVLDERDEICAVHGGVPGFDVGENTDILRLCTKTVGVQMAVRSLSPHVLVTDELWGEDQKNLMQTAAACGCSVLASVHGSGRRAVPEALFEVCITLGRKDKPGSVVEVYARA